MIWNFIRRLRASEKGGVLIDPLPVMPPAPGDKVFYGHVEFLKHNGIYILETMNTGRLARENVQEFMFVLGQARIKGTVQMIINPVALW